MAQTPFKVISWSPNELVSDDKLDAMVSNDNWLRDNMTQGYYTGHGVARKEGVKIAGGLALITARKADTAAKRVDFNNFFLSVCKPIVTTGIISGQQRRIWCTVDGIGKLHPDNRGFFVNVAIHAEHKKNRRIARNMYVSWQALGY